MFNEEHVNTAVNMMRGFAQERGLGRPVKILSHRNDAFRQYGVGCEWPDDVRNAVMLGSVADFEEARRRLERWRSEQVAA